MSKKKKKDGDPLDALGSMFDDLLEEADEGLEQARKELNRLADRSTARPAAPAEQEPADSRASRSRRPPQTDWEAPAGESDFCLHLKERIDGHAVHVARCAPDSRLWQQYRELVRTYRSRCGRSDEGGKLSVDPDAPEYRERGIVRASASRRPPDVFSGGELEDHRRRRASATYAPSTAREYNTDAMDLDSEPDALLETYRRLGRAALEAESPALHYPRSDDAQLRTALDRQKAAFREGYREALAARPSAGPAAPRSRRPENDPALTGADLEEHRRRRADEKYDPQTEREFVTDAKDLSEWAFQGGRLPEGHSEHSRATSRQEAILDVYRKLGKRAHDQDEPARNYPRSLGGGRGKSMDRLKQAFREGYREAQPGADR